MASDWARVKELFTRALELPTASRDDLLERECRDADERREVETLLAAARDASGFLEQPAATLASIADEPDPMVDRIVGNWHIVREIGQGGMGKVYAAERADDAFRKTVALKLVKRGMDTDEVVRRFRNERQVLAALEHPNIARIIDGGSTVEGVPFLVMEYVEGESIDHYCTARALPLRTRLDIFLAVCAAVDYAHRNLVVHRDLKPANIVVTAAGAPVLLDFGIARVLHESDAATGTTVFGVGPMTPGYAAPEQMTGGRITTATDVYALGVVLFELLTGARPYELPPSDFAAAQRIVVHCEPPRPSGKTASPAVARALRGDLDTIVMRALEKEPSRRYRSAADFADDIRRYLDGLPIAARPSRWTYRAGKFVRRHRAAVAVAVAVAVMVTATLSVAIRQRSLALAADARAEQQRSFAVAAANVMESDVAEAMAKMLGPTEARLRVLKSAQQVFDHLRASSTLSRSDRLRAAEGDRALAEAYRALGENQQALERLKVAEQLAFDTARRADTTAEEVGTLGAIYTGLGDTYAALRRRREADAAYDRAVNLLESACRARDVTPRIRGSYAMALSRKADHLFELGDAQQAFTFYRRVADVLVPALRQAPNDARLASLDATAHERMAEALYYTGKVAESCSAYADTLTRRRRAAVLANNAPEAEASLAITLENCGWCAEQENSGDAESLYRAGVVLQQRLLAGDPSNVRHAVAAMGGIGQLANSFVVRGRHAEAVPIYRDALKIAAEFRGRRGEISEVAAKSAAIAQLLADALTQTKRFDEADFVLRDTLTRLTIAAAGDPQNLAIVRDQAWTRISAGRLARARARYSDAVAHTRAAVALWQRAATSQTAADRQELAHAYHDLGVSLRAAGSRTAAHEAFTTGREVLLRLRDAGQLDAASDGAKEYLPKIESALRALHEKS